MQANFNTVLSIYYKEIIGLEIIVYSYRISGILTIEF